MKAAELHVFNVPEGVGIAQQKKGLNNISFFKGSCYVFI